MNEPTVTDSKEYIRQLRDKLIIAAVQGFAASDEPWSSVDQMAQTACKVADAVLVARAKE